MVVGYDDKGLPITKNVLAKTKSDCAAKLKTLQESIAKPVPDQPKPGILLGDWLNLWYQSYKKPRLRPNTQMSYERRIYQHIIPALGSIQLDKLTTSNIQQFYTELKQGGRLIRTELYGEGLSDQTVQGIHTTLHAALDKAVSEKLLFRNPADGCRLPPVKPREMQILTPEEIQRLQTILERAECKKVRFHDLRHVFCTASLEHGMDVKTLSTIIGHVSSSTTLNVYAHVTDEMRRTAAAKIDHSIGKAEPQIESNATPQKLAPSTFQAYKGKRRKAGTGCVTQINDRLWEGRYSPVWPADGKKHSRNVYAHSETECEKLLAELIVKMKAEINAEKERLKTD